MSALTVQAQEKDPAVPQPVYKHKRYTKSILLHTLGHTHNTITKIIVPLPITLECRYVLHSQEYVDNWHRLA